MAHGFDDEQLPSCHPEGWLRLMLFPWERAHHVGSPLTYEHSAAVEWIIFKSFALVEIAASESESRGFHPCSCYDVGDHPPQITTM